jgi:hypothetical protein
MLRTAIGRMDSATKKVWRPVTMRFLMTVSGGGQPPDKELVAEMGRFVEEGSPSWITVEAGLR